MTDTTSDKHVCDVEDPLLSQTRCPNRAELFRRYFWVMLNSFTGVWVIYICILLIFKPGSGPVKCMEGTFNSIASSGQHSNQSIITAPTILSLTVPPELQHYEDPLWQREKASELASAWGFLSGQLLFASVAGRMPK